jgi:hypothetical protein
MSKGQESHSHSFSLSGTTKLSNPPKKIEKSYEEQIFEMEISAVEKARLNAVFEYICGPDANGDSARVSVTPAMVGFLG